MMSVKPYAVYLVVVLLLLAGCAPAPSTRPGVRIDSAMLFQPTPKAAESLWQQAEREKAAGNLPAAIAIWNRIAQTYPNNIIAARALYEVAHIHLQQGDAPKSLSYLDYLIYHYSQWEGMPRARLDQMRAWSMSGRDKQVQKEADSLWDASRGHPGVQTELSDLMARIYTAEGNTDSAFDWLTAGFTAARTSEERALLTQTTLALLANIDEAQLNRLYKKEHNELMQAFLDFRRLQFELQQAPTEAARNQLRDILQRHPSHPAAEEMRIALRGAAVEEEFPMNKNRIGVLVPISGPYAQYGELVLRGMALAKNEWNDRNPHDPITLVIKDAQVDESLAVAAFDSLIKEDNVLAVIGPLGNQAARAISPMAGKYGVPMLSLTQKDENMGLDKTFTLHLLLDNKELVTSLVQHCRRVLGHTRFAVLYPEDRYGERLSRAFTDVINDMGEELLASVSYKSKTADFKDPIENLLSIARKNAPYLGTDETPFQALFIPDQVLTLSMLAPQLPYHNIVGVTLLGTNLWAEGPLLQAGGVYVEHAIFATPFFIESPSPKVRQFRQAYQEAYKTTPSYLGAQAYDALSLILEARSHLHPTHLSRLDLMEKLLSIQDFHGTAGTYSLNSQGEITRNYQILQVLNGELVQVGP